jgi:hypothetical protein
VVVQVEAECPGTVAVFHNLILVEAEQADKETTAEQQVGVLSVAAAVVVQALQEQMAVPITLLAEMD